MKFIKKEYLLSAFLLVFGVTMISSQATAQVTEEVETEVKAEMAVELSGMVVDKASGEAVEGAEIKIGEEVKAATEANGEFTIDSLKPGLHKVTVEAEGYESWTKELTLAEDGKKVKVELVASESEEDEG